LGFASEEDARRVMEVLPKRFATYGLTIHPEKTQVAMFKKTCKGMDLCSLTMYRFLFHCKGALAHLLGRAFMGKRIPHPGSKHLSQDRPYFLGKVSSPRSSRSPP